MNTEFDPSSGHGHQVGSTRELPQIPAATAMVDSARRADRTLLAVVGVAAVSLIVGAIAMFGPDSTTEARSAATTSPIVAPTAPTPDDSNVVDGGQSDVVPFAEPDPEPPVVEDPPAEQPDDVVGGDEPADVGDPDSDHHHDPDPCVEGADEGRQFFVPDTVTLDDGVLGGSFRIGSCSPDPLAIELSTVPGVLLSRSDFDLGAAGTDVHFIIVPEFFEDQDIEFEVKVYEVDCCADYIGVAAEKTWGLGELAPFDPGIFTMLTDTEGLDPNDADAVTQRFIDEYGWHPGYLDAPEAQLHDEDVLAFIEQYDVPSPWGDPNP